MAIATRLLATSAWERPDSGLRRLNLILACFSRFADGRARRGDEAEETQAADNISPMGISRCSAAERVAAKTIARLLMFW